MMTNTTLTAILNEKDVENLYRQYLTKKFGDIVFNSPFGCDGYGESKKHNVRILCEFKDDLDLSSKVNQVKVLSQVLYYIKKFEVSGKILPSVIFVGDRNECFAIHTNEIFNYLGMDFNWSIAPSNAHTNVELVTLMMEDNKINPHVFNIKDIADCVDKIKDLTDGVKRYIPITPHNVTEVFKHFEDNVIGSHKLDTNQMANLFVQLLVNPDENYLHPVARRKTVVTKAFHEVNLKSREVFESFFSHFSREYSPQQREHLTAVVDRLVQDVTRRKQGEFFTPTIWVDKAHEYIASVYGEDWKEKYVVWDPAWGTGNLTRDYKFKELYVSTLVYADIQTAEQMGYNPEAIKFQYDFLNDPYEYLPKGLKDAIESGREIIVLMNPPYKWSGNGKGKGGVVLPKTRIKEEMEKKGLSKSSQQLYVQFLYRIKDLGIKNSCFFSLPTFIVGDSFKKFINYYTDKNNNFIKGFLMDSNEFADTKSWGLTFSIFGESNQRNYEYDVLVNSLEGIKTFGKKLFKPANNKLSNKLNKSKNSIITLVYDTDVVNNTDAGVYFTNEIPNNNKRRFEISKDNLMESFLCFSIRKLIKCDFVNYYDEFEDNIVESDSIKYDSLVYSIFHGNCNTKTNNELFWMSKTEMIELANHNNYTELYNSARTDSDRYVYNILFGEQRIYDQLSNEAKDVLDAASNLVRISFEMRRNFADDTNHLNGWDAGHAQLKLLWKEYFPVQFKEFRDKYKVLEDKMRPMVYELGFLIK